MATNYKTKYPNGACSYPVSVTSTCNITESYDASSKIVGKVSSGDKPNIICFSASPYRVKIKKGSITGWINTECLKNNKGKSVVTLTKEAVNSYSCSASYLVAAYVIDGHKPTQAEIEGGLSSSVGYYGGSVSINCTLKCNSYLYAKSDTSDSTKLLSTSIKKDSTVTLINVSRSQTKSDRVRVKTSSGTIGWIVMANIITNSDGKSLWSSYTAANKSNPKSDTELASIMMNNSSDAVGKAFKKTEVKTISAELNTGSALYTNEKNIDGETLMKDNLSSIFAIPYQFHQIIDQRTISNKAGEMNNAFGRIYGEKIVTNMPLLLLTPGRPTFMPHYSKKDSNIIFKGLINNKVDSVLSEVLNQPGRYYDLKYAYSGYYKFVDPMMHVGAKLLGIENLKINISGYSAKLKDFHWINIINGKFKNFVGSKKFIGYYIDSQNQISESFDTSTTESQIASSINNISDLAKEVQFLLGSFAGKEIAIQDPSEYQKGLDKLTNIVDNNGLLSKGGKLFKSLGEAFTTVAAGGRMYFPEIWQDTTYTKSYDINIKLRCPDPNPLQWYLDIYAPLIHMVCLAAPQAMGPNGYASPFLVRAAYKGIFNVDMGIITSLDISKGAEGMWTVDGLPTVVDMNITIKDLYSTLSIIDNESPKNFLKNTAMVDYLANTCSININKENVERSIDLYMLLFTDKIKSLPNDIYTKLDESLNNKILKLFSGWSR